MDFIKIKRESGYSFLKVDAIVEITKDTVKESYIYTKEGDLVSITHDQADKLCAFLNASNNTMIEI